MRVRRSTRLLPVLLAITALGATGCASSGGGGSRSGGDPDLISREELQAVTQLDAYETIRRLRPQWLRSRTSTPAAGQVTASVYIDGMRRGDLSELRSIPASDIQEIRYLNASEATTRFGTDNAGGAILVTTRR